MYDGAICYTGLYKFSKHFLGPNKVPAFGNSEISFLETFPIIISAISKDNIMLNMIKKLLGGKVLNLELFF